MSEELLPCPFCGGEAVHDIGIPPLESVDWAWCNNPECPLHGELLFTVEQWNNRPESKSGWQPIESAPKDGTYSVYWDGASMEILNEPPQCALGKWTPDAKGWCGSSRSFHPTHWMPLPAPPQEK